MSISTRWMVISLVATALMAIGRGVPAASGDLSGRYGAHGRVIFKDPNLTQTYASHFFQQADGKTVVVGTGKASTNSPTVGVVVRFNDNGSLDTTFGAGGRAMLTDSTISFVSLGGGMQLANGKLLIVGSKLWILNPDGSLDSSFGTNGIANSPIYGSSVFLREDSSILVVGSQFQFAHFSATGALDASYGQGGVAMLPLSTNVAMKAAIRQPDGRMVAVGYQFDPVTGTKNEIAVRVEDDGSLDTSFGVGGKLLSSCNGCEWVGVTRQSDGKLLLVGDTETMLDGSNPSILQNHSIVERYNLDGTLDSGFSVNGRLTQVFANVNWEPIHAGELAVSATLDPVSGAIYVFGTLRSGMYGRDSLGDYKDGNVAVARLRADGSIDQTFGRNGVSIVPYAAPPFGYNFHAAEILSLTDGQLLVLSNLSLSNRFNANASSIGIAKLLHDGGDAGVLSVVAPDRVMESVGNAVFQLQRRGGSSGTVSVSYATATPYISPIGAGAGSDFTPVMGTITWADGDAASKEIVVPILSDGVTETNDKLFDMTLSNPTGGADIDTTSASITIARDDIAPAVSISFSQRTVSVSPGQESASITLTRTGTAPVSVNFYTLPRTAVPESDFTPSSGLLAWSTNDSTPRTITVPINKNASATGQSFDIVLVNTTPSDSFVGPTIASANTATVTIDAAQPPTVQSGGDAKRSGGSLGWIAIAVIATLLLISRRNSSSEPRSR